MRIEVPEWRVVDDVTWRRLQAIDAARSPSAGESDNRAAHVLSGIGRCARR